MKKALTMIGLMVITWVGIMRGMEFLAIAGMLGLALVVWVREE